LITSRWKAPTERVGHPYRRTPRRPCPDRRRRRPHATGGEDDEGRYVGAREQHADPIRRYFAAEYDAEYEELEQADAREELAEDAADVADADESELTELDAADAIADVQDAHWNTATTDIHEGAYDHALDALAEADLSSAKAEAVRERQAEVADSE